MSERSYTSRASAGSVAEAIAPKTATPTTLPAERANMVSPVTTPRSFQVTAACAAISEGAATQPRPKPTTNETPATAHGFGHGPTAARPAVPASATRHPESTVNR